MDPIKTAVKYSLIPLRAVVRLGDSYLGDGDEEQAPPPATQRATAGQGARRAGGQGRRRTQKPDPQASQAPKDLDDVAIARKVETVIFRDERVPKGDIDVNVAEGVVWLRGQAKTPDMVKALERQAADVPEVRRVENLLHLPKTPAPTRTDTPASQRKTRRTTRQPARRKVETGVTNERRTTRAEPLPEESARAGEGRGPSPLGSSGSS